MGRDVANCPAAHAHPACPLLAPTSAPRARVGMSHSRLFTVAALCALVLLVFAIVGVELFKGSMHHFCVAAGSDPTSPARTDPSYFRLEASAMCNPDVPGMCGDGMECAYHAATLMSGTLHFDDVGGALMALLKATTADNFDAPMHGLMDSVTPAAAIYFLLVIILCGELRAPTK